MLRRMVEHGIDVGKAGRRVGLTREEAKAVLERRAS